MGMCGYEIDHIVVRHYSCAVQILEIACGLEYLHRELVVHGDLRGVCCLNFIYRAVVS